MSFNMQQFMLKDKVALVTGGSRGIGRAIALGLASAGARVAITSRKQADLDEVQAELAGLGAESLAVAAHLGRMEDITRLIDAVMQKFGRIDVLVNNAATNPTVDPAIDYTERAWDAIMNLNLKGLFFLSQGAARIMKGQSGGSILNIASVEGIRPSILSVYGISKAGVIHATRVMAKEWASYNIRVNAIAPGITRTRFAEFWWKDPELLKTASSMTPLGRTAEPDEMVGAVIFLSSDASSYVTGQVLAVDGGISI